MTLYGALVRIGEDLAAFSSPFSLVGGVAIGIRTVPRFTRDLDLAVAIDDDASAERLVKHLHGFGYTTYSTIEQRATGRLATVRMLAPGEDPRVPIDLLLASSGIEPEICAAAQRVEIVPGVASHVARAGHLVALKLLSVNDRRLQDSVDLMGLRAVMTPEEIVLAQEAVRLIVARGTHRGRDLVSDLEAWLRSR